MPPTPHSPELRARVGLYELLLDRLAASGFDVHYGPPGDDAGRANVWVGGFEFGEQPHGMRGGDAPSHRGPLRVHVHVDFEDEGGSAVEVSIGVSRGVSLVREALREAHRDKHAWGDGLRHPTVRDPAGEGPVPLTSGGWVEHVLVPVQFTATI